MSYAFITPSGEIRQIVSKPTPFMRLEPGERMVRYDLPVVDEELASVQPVTPVPDNAQEVSFTVHDHSPEVVKAVRMRRATAAVQAHMDQVAQSYGYTNMLFAASYASSTHPKFGAEGRALSAWRDACWEFCYGLLDEVDAGSRAAPAAGDLVEALPHLDL